VKSQGVFLEIDECWLRLSLVTCGRFMWICGIISLVLSGIVIFLNLQCVLIPPTKSGHICKLGLDCVNIPPLSKTVSQKIIHRSTRVYPTLPNSILISIPHSQAKVLVISLVKLYLNLLHYDFNWHILKNNFICRLRFLSSQVYVC
jgi:hypothetical protein